MSESLTLSQVRLEGASVPGVMLFRNNVGALVDKYGRPVRFGLANESKAENERIKSADLIGWRTVTITPDMVGRQVAVFLSRECKHPGWTWGGTAHEIAQLRWRDLVLAAGGDAAFATGPGTLSNPGPGTLAYPGAL